MKRAAARLACTVACALALVQTAHAQAPAVAQQQPTVEVFTLLTLPVTNAHGSRIYYVDAINQLEAHMSQGLPGDEQQAAAMVRQRMAAMGTKNLMNLAQGAADGLGRAVVLKVDRVPAVVFSGRFIVYGVTDVAEARRIFDSRVTVAPQSAPNPQRMQPR